MTQEMIDTEIRQELKDTIKESDEGRKRTNTNSRSPSQTIEQ